MVARRGPLARLGVLLVLVAFVAAACSAADADDDAAMIPAGARLFASPAAPARVVTPGLDFANPFVLVDGGRYFVYTTQIHLMHVPVRSGTALDQLGRPHDVLPQLPPWARPGYTWAPDVRKVADGRYVLWFTAGMRGGRPDAPNSSQCIGVAVGTSPDGPFQSDATEPSVCQLERWGSIDPRTFRAEDGTLWLHWKSDDNAQARSTQPAAIFAQRLAEDGVTLVGEPTELIEADLPWEGHIVEAPQMVEADGRHWLFYSGNWFNQPGYGVGVAACESPAGPCRKTSKRPWLRSNAQGQGPGEGSLFEDAEGWWTVYSPTSVKYEEFTRRPMALAAVGFGPDGPFIANRPSVELPRVVDD